MKSVLFSAVLCVGISAIASAAFAQGTEDSVASGGKFPLAAPAGVDSGAELKAPSGAANQGAFDMNKWKYGPVWDAPAGSKIWNPVKIKMMQGGKVTGGTVFYAKDGQDLLRHGQCRLRLHLDRTSA
jgi:hypothetical protein